MPLGKLQSLVPLALLAVFSNLALDQLLLLASSHLVGLAGVAEIVLWAPALVTLTLSPEKAQQCLELRVICHPGKQLQAYTHK
jgi:hypothetical protein